LEAQLIYKSWSPIAHDERRRLTIAVMRDDVLCAPLPPIAVALDGAIQRLRFHGHKLVEWRATRLAESEELLFTFLPQDLGDEYREHLAVTDEPAGEKQSRLVFTMTR